MFEVSIIIPSYNRYPLNLHSLHALENQTFDLSKMEIIFIDDASTDNTPQLKNYNPPFRFHYVRNETNKGLATSRNIGFKMAQANIIIFLDAEIIVDPDYVKNQYRFHLTNEQAVVVGRNTPKVYTYLFPEFNFAQINEICDLAHNSLIAKQRLNLRLRQDLTDIDLRAYIKNLKDSIQLLDQKDMKDFSQFKSFSVPNTYYQNLFEQLGDNLDKRYLSWWCLFGFNHSLKKNLFSAVGGYDENFKGWGPEDAEFSYRLYKAGAKFIFDPHSTLYHQEHPISANKSQEGYKNRILFQQKHPLIDVCIRSLKYIERLDLQFVDMVLQDHDCLCHDFPERFEDFKNSIVFMLQQIHILKSQKKPVCNFLQSSGITDDSEWKERIFSERNVVETYGKYSNLVQLFDLLASK
ncbi:glycosyltransferase involved in cell wall biosynthesis [Neobacillus niacini]|uniref:glycosyltransferase family 2 protein n=1 Tax=Neobacillus niacini TaxID=86668 RepID=UPI00285D5640|nr:glycosyltransferase [Neobacillus niacini]MDR7076116.1 glycosyltransferase involved in cell wall biosynthesis [Neobacillus niacini]